VPVKYTTKAELPKRHFVTIRSSCSTTSGTAREPCCGRETSTALIVWQEVLAPAWNVTSTKGFNSSGVTLPLPNEGQRHSDEKNRESIFILQAENYFGVA